MEPDLYSIPDDLRELPPEKAADRLAAIIESVAEDDSKAPETDAEAVDLLDDRRVCLWRPSTR